MPVNLRKDGYFEVEYVGPYGGVNTMMPENMIPEVQSPALSDVILRNAEIRSRPALIPVSFPVAIPSPKPTLPITEIGVVNGKLWAVTDAGAGGGVFRFNFFTGAWTNDSGAFTHGINYRIFNNSVYSVITGHLATWDALGSFTLDNANIPGPQTVGALFIDELDNHLLMANTSEGSGGVFTNFGQRVRWSATGLPAQWDTTVNINAGFADFIEVPDQITGLMMLGRVGYIFRTDGITEVAPTGRGQAPFDFNHLWASQYGIGGGLFYALAQYGTVGFFVARDNVYSVQSFQLQQVGASARDAIFTDLGQATSTIFGAVMPAIDYDVPFDVLFPPGPTPVGKAIVPYLVYYLIIPQATGTRVWVYSMEDQNWVNWFFPNIKVTGRPVTITVQSAAAGNPPQSPMVVWPVVDMTSGLSYIAQLDGSSFNDPNQGSSYSYRTEDIVPHRVPTVRRVILTYRDLGQATINVKLTGTDDNAKVQSSNVNVTIGNVVPTNALMTKFVDVSLTAFRPQLSWSKVANGGNVAITRAVMVGTVEVNTTL